MSELPPGIAPKSTDGKKGRGRNKGKRKGSGGRGGGGGGDGGGGRGGGDAGGGDAGEGSPRGDDLAWARCFSHSPAGPQPSNARPASTGRGRGGGERTKEGHRHAQSGGRGPCIPDIAWLAVPEDHLRAHPLYRPLPPPAALTELKSIADLALFRQDSWQWLEMHRGRLTTSKAAAVLGLLEPIAASQLRIPQSLQGHHHAVGAFEHLSEPPTFVSVTSAAKLLLEDPKQRSQGAAEEEQERLNEIRATNWKAWDFDAGWRGTMWSTEYCLVKPPDLPKDESNQAGLQGAAKVQAVRLAWGNYHEATAVLVAVNVFHRKGAVVHEVGMYPAETLMELTAETPVQRAQHSLVAQLSAMGCKIGASPDGLVQHADGQVEVLEVKNHCPFHFNRSTVCVRDNKPTARVPVWYIPQLQLEMFCVGPSCQSAVMVRLTATQGAVVLRVQRDDDYIIMMLERFLAFHTKYVRTNTPPPDDFDATDEQLLKLIAETARVAETAMVVRTLTPGQIQRSRPGNSPLIHKPGNQQQAAQQARLQQQQQNR